jgi:transcriptional regulator with XRE-family HTH domain
MPVTPLAGTRIRERRTALGLRQAEVAARAGISASYLNLIEHNRRAVAADLLGRLAQALDTEPARLTGEEDALMVDALREAAAAAPAAEAESDRIEEFTGRFPGWAALVAQQYDRIAQMERTIETLSDRMAHDPHLSASLHELLSSVASVRSTAAILADTPDIEPEWRARFQTNLAQDTARLAQGAEALVGYLDTIADLQTGIAAPQEEFEAFLDARGWHLPALEAGAEPDAMAAAAPELASAAARTLARGWLSQWRDDARAMPLDAVRNALARVGPDPGLLAGVLGVEPAAVFRRLALMPPGDGAFGLTVCDGSGTLLLRKPLPGFGMPRFGAACPLWPIYLALSRPAVPVRATVEMAGRTAVRFLTFALCQPSYQGGFDTPPVLRAYMLILPAAAPADGRGDGRGEGPGPVVAAGSSCRICPRPVCPARREPAIMGVRSA